MSNFYDMYYKIKDMEIGNVNDINSQNVELTAIDGIDVGVREDPDIEYTYDDKTGQYVPNRQPKPGEIGYAPTGRIN